MQQNHSRHFYLHYLRLIKSDLQEVYINLIIQSFALSLISIFVPIYLIRIGYSINHAFAFAMVELGMLSLFSPIAAKMAKRIGFKHMILYRLPLLLLYFAGLYMLEYIRLPIYGIAFIGGVGGSMYWVSLHALFAKYSDKLKRGAQAGKLISFPQIATLIGPSLGGIIAVSFGFKALIVLSSVFLVLSAVPLFFTGDMKPHVPKFSIRKMFLRSNRKFMVIFAAQGFIAISGTIVWPVFVFFTLKDIASVGFMATISAVGVILFTLFLGKAADRKSCTALMRAGGILLALTFFLRIYATTFFLVFALSFFAGLFAVLIDLPVLKYFYDTANENNITEVVVMREMGLGIGRIVGMIIILLALNKFAIGLSLGGIASLVFSII